MTAGRPAFAPTDKDRATVKTMTAFGIPETDVAKVIGIDPKTLRKYFSQELATGHVEVNAKVAQSLYKKATGDGNGSVIAAIFWLKARAGWKDRAPDEEIGKKAKAVDAAKAAGTGSEWGDDLSYTSAPPN